MIGHATLLILLGFLLDSIIGDPETKVHPVRLVGLLIQKQEAILYSSPLSKRMGGIILVIATLAITLGIGLGIEKILFSFGNSWGYLWDIFIFYIGLAFRSLIDAGISI